MLMKRLAVPHEVEKGVVLPPRLSTLDAECTAGTTIPCGWSRRSSSLKVIAEDDATVAEEDVDDAADGLSSAAVEVGGVDFSGRGESSNVSLWCGWIAANGEDGYNAGLEAFRLFGTCDEGKRVGGASERVPPSSEHAFSQFGHLPSALGPCSHCKN